MTHTNKSRVYFADVSCLEDAELFRRLYRQTDAARRERIDRMHFEKDKYLSLGAGVLLRKALNDLGFDAVPDLAYGAHGKPYFPDLPELHFNLSHSGTKVLCAVSDRSIGCDAEKIGSYNEKLVRRFFHPEECTLLLSAPDASAQTELFYRLWTLKESFLKATGLGLSLPLDSFAVCLRENRISVLQTVCKDPCGFYLLDFDPGYEYACCIMQDSGENPPETVNAVLSSL